MGLAFAAGKGYRVRGWTLKMTPTHPQPLRARLCAILSTVAAGIGFGGHSLAEEAHVRVSYDAEAEGIAVAPTMVGLFFEDINYAADGGLYAELVENRSFEHRDRMYSWKDYAAGGARGEREVRTEGGVHPNNPVYVRLQVRDAASGFGLVNDGYDGILLRAGEVYRFSVHARSTTPAMVLGVLLLAEDGSELARAGVMLEGGQWSRHEVELKPAVGCERGRLAIVALSAGEADLDMVSLFPANTFKGRRNGMRADLAQALADLRPGFLRFPGGCIVEGHGLANAYRWKDTVGDISQRKQNWNLWTHENSPQYHQTYGLGFFEYFQLAEDLGAEAVPVLNCGMTCQVRGGAHCPVPELGEWVQDALDLVEFATGPVDSKWGALRAQMGRAEPFKLKKLGVGNEQWGPEYFERYQIFHRALKAAYPWLEIISTSGPAAADGNYRYAWERFRTDVPADLVDEHYYVPPQWLLANTDRYASYDRSGPKVFVGEFAAHDRGRRATVRAAVAEAAYLTGLFRQADIVTMTAYAPLLAKVGHVQWEPNLLWFDNARLMRTTSYHVQALFGRNRPDFVVPTRVDTLVAAPPPRQSAQISLGTWRTEVEYDEVSFAAPDGRMLLNSDFETGAPGWDLTRGHWEVKDGALRQTSRADDRAAVFELPGGATEGVLSFRARRLAGEEGFLVRFPCGAAGQGEWNLGGWGNTSHGLTAAGANAAMQAGSIDLNRWYDVRIEVKEGRVAGYLDGTLVQEARVRAPQVQTLYAVAGRADSAGEWVIFVANPADVPVRAELDPGVVPFTDTRAGIWTWLGGDAEAANTFEQPTKVSPRTEATEVRFKHGVLGVIVPPNSAGVLRFPTR